MWNNFDHVSIILDTSSLLSLFPPQPLSHTHTPTNTHTDTHTHTPSSLSYKYAWELQTTLLAWINHILPRFTLVKMKVREAVWWERPRLTEGAQIPAPISHKPTGALVSGALPFPRRRTSLGLLQYYKAGCPQNPSEGRAPLLLFSFPQDAVKVWAKFEFLFAQRASCRLHPRSVY